LLAPNGSPSPVCTASDRQHGTAGDETDRPRLGLGLAVLFSLVYAQAETFGGGDQ